MRLSGELRRVLAWFEEDGWRDVWHAVYVASLLIATVAAGLDRDVAAVERAGMAILATAAAAWYLVIARRFRYWEANASRYAVMLGVAAVMWVPLVRWHPAYGWTVVAAYGVAACPWLRRAVPTVVALTILLAALDHTDGTALTGGELAAYVAVGLVVLLAHATIGGIARESDRRQRLIEELEATRDDLARRERQAGVLEERQRLARDIHDGLAQGFASIVTLLEAADARLPADAVEARAAVDQARQAARDSLGETRRLVWALRDDHDDPHNALIAALERLAERTRAVDPGVELDVQIIETGTPEQISTAAEVALLRTAQEAVANAARHAQARTIILTLSWLGDHVILDVADDGAGFDPISTGPRSDLSGFGLTGLRERAAAVGATLDIDSRPGAGTIVTLDLPLHAADTSPAGPSPAGPSPAGTSPDGASPVDTDRIAR